MVYPLCVVEHFVHQFLAHWNCGLSPTITLLTKEDGTISINYNVDASIPSHKADDYPKQKSGRGPRSRRRKCRSIQPSEDNPNENALNSVTQNIINELEINNSTSLSSSTPAECNTLSKIPTEVELLPDSTTLDVQKSTQHLRMDFTSNIDALDSKLTDLVDKAQLDLHRMITEVENQVNHINPN